MHPCNTDRSRPIVHEMFKLHSTNIEHFLAKSLNNNSSEIMIFFNCDLMKFLLLFKITIHQKTLLINIKNNKKLGFDIIC